MVMKAVGAYKRSVNVLLFQGKNQIRADSLEEASERSQYKADDTRLHERIPVPEALKEHCSDYRINLFEIAFLPEEQIQQFQSDFRIVADFFRQQRVYGDYIPDQRTIRHVDAVLKFLSVFTDDERFSEAARVFQAEKKEETTMTKVLDRVENRGIQKGIQRGIMETKLQLYQAMRNRGLSEQEALAFAESVAEKAAQALRERE